jgi:hypothetical protein
MYGLEHKMKTVLRGIGCEVVGYILSPRTRLSARPQNVLLTLNQIIIW